MDMAQFKAYGLSSSSSLGFRRHVGARRRAASSWCAVRRTIYGAQLGLDAGDGRQAAERSVIRVDASAATAWPPTPQGEGRVAGAERPRVPSGIRTARR